MSHEPLIIDELMNYLIICYRCRHSQEFNSKFQSSRVSKFQSFKVSKLQSAKGSKFRGCKISKFQPVTIPRFQDSKKTIVSSLPEMRSTSD